MKEYVKPVAESWDIVWETANVQGCSSQKLLTVAKNNDGFGLWFDSVDTNTIIELFYYGHFTEASKIQHVNHYSAQKMSPTAEPNNVEAI